MTVAEIVGLAAERGLRIEVDYLGNPRLRGPREEVTPALLTVLKLYREDLVEALPREPAPVGPREWLWRTGYVEAERPGSPTWGKSDAHKDTAFWWRKQGQCGWQPVPGRNPEGLPLPAGEKLEVAA